MPNKMKPICPPKDLVNIGIVGSGKMGSGIFNLLSSFPVEITVCSRSKENACLMEQRFFKKTRRSLRRGTIAENEFEKKINSVKFTDQWENLANCDLIIETTVESPEIKRNAFNRLKNVVGKDTILTTNTSSLSITKMAQETGLGNRLCGLHFFHPVPLVDLVEIIVTGETPTKTVATLKEFCKKIGRTSIIVKDSPGSLINMILSHLYFEALFILEEGLALPSRVDNLARKHFYIGPCESLDSIGIDFFVKALKNMASLDNRLFDNDDLPAVIKHAENDLGGNINPYFPDLLKKLISENRLGKKVNQGIYLYDGGKMMDDHTNYYLNPSNLLHRKGIDDKKKTEEIISERLLFSIFSGVLRAQETNAASCRDIDLGVKQILQMCNGPFELMRRLGKETVNEGLENLSIRANIFSRKPCFFKSDYLSNHIDPMEILEVSYQKVTKFDAYRCTIETMSINGKKRRATYRYLYQSPGNIRIELTGPFKRGSVIVIRNDGKIMAKPGGILSFMTVELKQDSPYLIEITGKSAIESSWPYLFCKAKKMAPDAIESHAKHIEYRSRQAYEIDTIFKGTEYDRIRMIIDKEGPVLFMEYFFQDILKSSVSWEQIEINPEVNADTFDL